MTGTRLPAYPPMTGVRGPCGACDASLREAPPEQRRALLYVAAIAYLPQTTAAGHPSEPVAP